VKKCLKQNLDNMLDAMYGPSGVDPKTFATMNALFDQVNKVGAEMGRKKQHCKGTLSFEGSSQT